MPNSRHLLLSILIVTNLSITESNCHPQNQLTKFAQQRIPLSFGISDSAGTVSIDPKTDMKNIGFLTSSKTVDGKTIEQYSDGLVVEIDSLGNRQEEKESFRLDAKVPELYSKGSNATVDNFIKNVVHLGRMKGQNSSLLQSRLFQYSSYYLSLGETSKAQPLVKEFFEIQNRIHEKGEPFTDAEKKYRLALKGSE